MPHLIDIIFHLNIYLGHWVQSFGIWTYFILFAVLFCETGLVIFPLLPGDSLLFAVGAICALEDSKLNIGIAIPLMIIAVLCGDWTNYWVGRRLGRSLVKNTRLIRPEHLSRTELFYDRHGNKTVVLARFVPIVRTVAPFVAGLGVMRFPRFVGYSVLGAVLWISGLTFVGYFFGNLPEVQTHFHYVILAIIVLSLMPILFQGFRGSNATETKD